MEAFLPKRFPLPDARQRYAQWVREYSGRLWRLGMRLTFNAQDAEDLVQETFLEAWKTLRGGVEPRAPAAWLAGVLLHRAGRRRRRVQRSVQVERLLDPAVDAADLPAPDLDLFVVRDRIQDALAALDPDRRAVFLLVYQEGLSCRETGELLGIPKGTVLSRLHRARGELRVVLRHFHSSGAGSEQARDGSEQAQGGLA